MIAVCNKRDSYNFGCLMKYEYGVDAHSLNKFTVLNCSGFAKVMASGPYQTKRSRNGRNYPKKFTQRYLPD